MMDGGGAGMFMALAEEICEQFFRFTIITLFFYVVLKNVFLASWEIVVLLLCKNNKVNMNEPEVPAVPPAAE